jgi:hypothetical protein
MSIRHLRPFVHAACWALLWAPVSGALAQSATTSVRQVLERHAVFNAGAVLELDLEGRGTTGPDLSSYGVVPVTGFTACHLHASRGLSCLDGKDVRRWTDPRDGGGVGALEFSCTNPALRLDAARDDVCSTMTQARDGSYWIAGRRSGVFRIIRVLERRADGSCPEGAPLSPTAGVASRYCFREYAGNQVRTLRLIAVDRSEAAVFDPGTGVASGGVLGLDNNGAVRFFRAPGTTPRLLVTGRTGWGISRNEVVDDLALLQVPAAEGVDNFLLAATNLGRVLARQTDAGGVAGVFETFRAPSFGSAPAPGLPTPCSSGSQRFGIAASAAAGQAYLTDRNFCQVYFLRPTDRDGSDADETPFERLVSVLRDGEELTLSTVAAPGSVPASYPPDGPMRTPGVLIDLADCEGTCVLRRDDAGIPVATLSGVRRSTDPSLLLLLQAVNIPDCRYLTDEPDCEGRGAVIGPAGDPDAQYLDVTRLLPADITDQFAALGLPPPNLPPLLIPPSYRAQAFKGYRFGAFFGITEPGVVFIDTFRGEWDVEGLSGAELGCDLGYPRSTALGELLGQDIIVTASERYITAGGPAGVAPPTSGPDLRYVATVINNGCGSTRSGVVRWSVVGYDLEIAYNPTSKDDRDDVFAVLLERLYPELASTQRDLACKARVDSTDSAPLAPSTCAMLDPLLEEAGTRLARCIASTRNGEAPQLLPPPAVFDWYCGRFLTSFRRYRDALALLPPGTPEQDPANRIGELKARAETFEHLFVERFFPSVPPRGFTTP